MKTYPNIIEETDGLIVSFYTGLDAEAVRCLPPNAPGVALPPEQCFVAELLDTVNGKVYPARYSFCNLQPDPDTVWDGESETMVEVWTLHRYMLGSHWCGCHRVEDIVGEKPWMDECDSERLLVQSFTHPALPGVNLLREELQQVES